MLLPLLPLLATLAPLHARLTVLHEELADQEFDLAAFAHRARTEGEKVGERLVASACPGVQEKVEEFQYWVVELEGEEGVSHVFELVSLVDLVINTETIHNLKEAWISADLYIR